MKPVYANINVATGAHIAGICKIQVVAREWLESPLVIDFNTGKVTTAVDLVAGKSFLELNFTQDSYEFIEKPKSSKSGDYFETNISGLVNDLDSTMLQQLETWRHHQLVAIVTDRKKRMRICGNIDHGLNFIFSIKNVNAQNGLYQISIDMEIQTDAAAPFYEV